MTSSQPDNNSLAVLSIPSPENLTRREVACTYRGIQGKRLIIESNEVIPVYTAVTLQHEDALYLGDVMSCSALAASQIIEIRIAQVLSGLQSLLNLRGQLLGAPLSRALSLVPAGADN